MRFFWLAPLFFGCVCPVYLVAFYLFCLSIKIKNIYLTYGAPHLKKPVPQVILAPQGPKMLLSLSVLCALHLK